MVRVIKKTEFSMHQNRFVCTKFPVFNQTNNVTIADLDEPNQQMNENGISIHERIERSLIDVPEKFRDEAGSYLASLVQN